MTTITQPAYAKLNLTLDILGRRPDGYHELRSVMQLTSLSDEVELDVGTGEDWKLECDAPGIPTDGTNLAWKAAGLYRERAGIASGVEITLVKRIPVAAGLGGGSSDAAAVLKLMQRRFNALAPEELDALAVKIGADVPFFLRCVPAIGRGVGERLEAVPEIPARLPLLIAAPLFPVSAAWSYRHRNHAAAHADTRSLTELLAALRESDFARAVPLLRNDLEYAVLEKFPLLAILKRKLEMENNRVMVSGSGPTLFVFYESFEARERALKSVRALAEQYAFALMNP